VRAQAVLFGGGGVVGFLGVVLPHAPDLFAPGLLVLQALCLIAAGGLLGFGTRLPSWMLTAGPWAGVACTTVSVVFSADGSSAYALFYLWIGFYACYFLSPARTMMLAAFIIANYAGALVWLRVIDAPPQMRGTDDLHQFTVIVGTLLVASWFIVLLRRRVRALIQQLTDAARTDPLTELLNRRGFAQRLELEFHRAVRTGRTFSLLLADCDRFKLINDQLGHDGGDHALRRVSAALQESARRIDTVARIGGEEFAILLPGADAHEAYLAAERLRETIASAVPAPGAPALTVSFGVASFPAHAKVPDALMRAADEALYAAKALGRNQTVVHSDEIEGILSRGSGETSSAETRLATVVALAEALDLRDSSTARHSETVGLYSRAMAEAMGLDARRTERVRLAGVLHDIGKVAVPDAILNKPGALSEPEWAHMRRHPEIGARILSGAELADVRGWVLAHHERPDGRGYPAGLGAGEIPLEARILAVADAYEAMTSDRPYRAALDEPVAREQLRAGAGSQFDEGVVGVFLRLLEESPAGALAGRLGAGSVVAV
jgi:diguanylate cyclase (GGDEF)-like protein